MIRRFRCSGALRRFSAVSKGLKRLVDIVPSPANGITLDTGVTREMGHDPVEVIRYFGKRKQINHITFQECHSECPPVKVHGSLPR